MGQEAEQLNSLKNICVLSLFTMLWATSHQWLAVINSSEDQTKGLQLAENKKIL